MYLKIVGSLLIGLMFITGCGKKQGGSEQDQQQGQEQASPEDQQEMPGEMQEEQDIDVSDEEIEKFVEAVNAVQSINQGAQEEMSKTIEDEGMDPRRFQEIQQSQQSQQQGDAQDVSDKEMQQYQSIMKEMESVQSGLQEDMKDAIEDVGLTMERYQQIANAAQNDTALMQRIQKKLEGSMGQQ
ncbi:MAG: DUF4168 domain-containing protein [Bacteroidota bacterium]